MSVGLPVVGKFMLPNQPKIEIATIAIIFYVITGKTSRNNSAIKIETFTVTVQNVDRKE